MTTDISGEIEGKRAVKDNPLSVCLSDGSISIDSSNPLPISITNEYLTQVALGNISGSRLVVISGNNPDMALDTQETIWDPGGTLTYLTSDTTLFGSSTSTSDTAVNLSVFGLDDNYNRITRTVTLNGQNQVALSGDMFRVIEVINTGSVAAQGDIYIAESDTLTGGVPDTASKIKSKIILGNNRTKNGFFTVEAGSSAVVLDFSPNAPKNTDICYRVFSREENGVFLINFISDIYQNTASVPITAFYNEKTDIEAKGTASNEGSSASFIVRILVVEN